MNNPLVKLKWIRPETPASTYPKVWKTFKARDLESNALVEYRIQDLPESRIEEAMSHMLANFLIDEPLLKVFDSVNDADCGDDYELIWRSAIAQKASLVCVKADSDEMVGVNINFVTSKGETFFEEVYKLLKSPITKGVFDIIGMLYENFDVFEHYGVDEYLSSFGLSVDKKFRGRAIGEQLLLSRKEFCEALGLKLTHTSFTNAVSGKIAGKIGFKTDVELSYDKIHQSHPEYPLSNIASREISIKTWMF